MTENTSQTITTISPRVAQILEDGYQLVITAGEDSGVKVGDKFLVYAEGQDVLDPVTKEYLGKLDRIRGRGVVSIVYPRFCVIDSLEMPSSNPKKRIHPNLLGIASKITMEVTYGPFIGPQVGDFARPV